jgi:transcriptional regulator with XRE-family HTH domain
MHIVHMTTTLQRYFEEKRIKSDREFADQVGCARSMITRIRLGKVQPSLPVAAKIEEVTKGKVKAVSMVLTGSGEQ